MSNLAIIQATDISPEIRYPKPEQIEIVDYDKAVERVEADIARLGFEDFDGTIPADRLDDITRDDVKVAKKMRTGINARATAIDDRRKEVKRAWTEPLSIFETKANALRDKYKAESNKLKLYIDTAEEHFKSMKRQELKEFWQGASILAGVIPFERVEKADWMKASVTTKQAEEELAKIIERIAGDIEAIEATCGDWAEQCKLKYYDTLSLSDAMAEKKKLEEIAAAAKRMEEERAAIKAAQEEAAREAVPAPVEAPTPPPARPVAPPQLARATSLDLTFSLRFEGTSEDMKSFRYDLRELLYKHPRIACKLLKEEK